MRYLHLLQGFVVCKVYHDLWVTHHILIKGRFEVVPSLHVRVDVVSNKGGGDIASPIPELGNLVVKDNCQSGVLAKLSLLPSASRAHNLTEPSLTPWFVL